MVFVPFRIQSPRYRKGSSTYRYCFDSNRLGGSDALLQQLYPYNINLIFIKPAIRSKLFYDALDQR